MVFGVLMLSRWQNEKQRFKTGVLKNKGISGSIKI